MKRYLTFTLKTFVDILKALQSTSALYLEGAELSVKWKKILL